MKPHLQSQFFLGNSIHKDQLGVYLVGLVGSVGCVSRGLWGLVFFWPHLLSNPGSAEALRNGASIWPNFHPRRIGGGGHLVETSQSVTKRHPQKRSHWQTCQVYFISWCTSIFNGHFQWENIPVGCHPKKNGVLTQQLCTWRKTWWVVLKSVGYLWDEQTGQQRNGTLFFHPWRVNFAKKKSVGIVSWFQKPIFTLRIQTPPFRVGERCSHPQDFRGNCS